MGRKSTAQLNIRSDFAKARATEIARETGMSVTQVVEDAVRAYTPQPVFEPVVEEVLPEGLIRMGRFLVFKGHGGRKTTIEETLAAIEDSRNRDIWGNYED